MININNMEFSQIYLNYENFILDQKKLQKINMKKKIKKKISIQINKVFFLKII